MATPTIPSLTIVADAKFIWTFRDPQLFGAVVDSAKLAYSEILQSGTGLDQCDRLWHDERTVDGGENDDLDLTGLDSFYFAAPVTVSIARAKLIVIVNTSTESGDRLVLDSSAANAYLGPFDGSATSKLAIGPASMQILADKKDGFGLTTTTNKILRVHNPGANPITYQILIAGTSV